MNIVNKEEIKIDDIDTKSCKDIFSIIKQQENYQEIKPKYGKYFKQGTGNAIERFAKNLNACSMLVNDYDIFPYILFAAGCDFHHTETIRNRLVQGNFFKPNYGPNDIDSFDITVPKRNTPCCCFVKSHHYMEESQFWEVNEIERVLFNACMKSFHYYLDNKFLQ